MEIKLQVIELYPSSNFSLHNTITYSLRAEEAR